MKDIKLRPEDIIRGLKGEDVNATLRDALEYIRFLESSHVLFTLRADAANDDFLIDWDRKWRIEDDDVRDRAWADGHPFDFGDS